LTDKKKPLISVIMPAYNASRFIKDSVLSVISQTYTNWELLIINDGSTDNTGEIVKSFADPRIRYFEKENGGVSSARNLGLKEMKGDFFCFLDSDDELPENSLELRSTYLEEHPEIDLLDGWVLVMDQKMGDLQRVYGPFYKGKVAKFFIRVDDKYFFGPNLMIRNKHHHFRFNENMTHVEDLWFYTELAWKGNLQYGHVNDVIYHYRRTPGSAMSNLEGLEKGYRDYYNNVKGLPGVTKQELAYLKKRIIRIMFLSYLKNKKFFRAIKVFFSKD
jgi:glycosyltransferase involved in cell wall biosynthesis